MIQWFSRSIISITNQKFQFLVFNLLSILSVFPVIFQSWTRGVTNVFEVVNMHLILLWIHCCLQESHPESNFRVPAIVNVLEKMELTPKVLNAMYNILHSSLLRL